MIFISGVHGVGKTYFAEKVGTRLNIKTYSSSKLIEEYKKTSFDSDKLVKDIEDNQTYLLMAVRYKEAAGEKFLLDGHFCLQDSEGIITRIPAQTFVDLKPQAIVLLTEKPEVIAERRMARDGKVVDLKATASFQDEEEKYATEVAELLQVPLMVSKGSADIEEAIKFIAEMV